MISKRKRKERKAAGDPEPLDDWFKRDPGDRFDEVIDHHDLADKADERRKYHKDDI